MSEQKRILEMVAGGDLSVDDGARLLEALGSGDRPRVSVETEREQLFREDAFADSISQAVAGALGGVRQSFRVRRRPAGRSIDQILSYASMGVSADYVRAIKEVLEEASPDDLIGLKSMGVTPEYVREVTQIFDDASVDDIIGLASMGVTAEYIRNLEAIEDLVDVEQVIEKKAEDVE